MAELILLTEHPGVFLKTRKGKWGSYNHTKNEGGTTLLRKLKEIFRKYRSQPVSQIIHLINPILGGWVNYFRIGNFFGCFNYVRDWVEKKIRRHLLRARKRHGFGWNRWSRVFGSMIS